MLFSSPLPLIVFCLFLLLQGCSSAPVAVEGSGARADWIRATWVPKTADALTRFDALAASTTGKPPSRKMEVRLAASAEAAKEASAKNPQALVVRMDSGLASTQVKRGVIEPVHAAALLWQGDIAAGREGRIPVWLREGVAYETAYRVLDSIKTPALRSADSRDDNEGVIRKKKGLVSESAMLSGEMSSDPSAAGFAELSAVFVDLLRVRQGENFQAAWLQYFREAAAPDFVHEAAFQKAFGLSATEFDALAKARVAHLRTARNEHSAALLATLSPFMEAGAAGSLPSSRLREAYANYLKGDSPKAFAFARQGFWSADYDSAYSIERAMRLCSVGAPFGCRLYAVDDKIIVPPVDAGGIEVVMASKGDDWASAVESRWLPVIKMSAERFNAALKDKLGVKLTESARIYVVSNRQDYSRVLSTEINQGQVSAERTAAASDGFSNSRGQMVTSVFAEAVEDYRWELATTITLHELVHELQGQLEGGNDGFYSQRWLTEGTADQIAYLVAKDIPIEPSAKYEVDNWREHNLDWYKLTGARTTKPEDVLDVNFEQWLQLPKSGKAPYRMSGLMVMHLESLLGEKYYPALVSYWRLAAQKGQREDAAFLQSFGMSREQFLASLKLWLASLVAT